MIRIAALARTRRARVNRLSPVRAFPPRRKMKRASRVPFLPRNIFPDDEAEET